MILGIDLGNYSIKTSEGLNVQSKMLNGTGILTTSPLVEYAGRQFVLGEGEFDTEYRKVRKENYLSLLFASIALSSEKQEITTKVVLGLPVSQYKTDKKELINLVLQNIKMEGSVGGEFKKIFIEDVEVYPEGIGCVQSNFEGVLVDIGGRTTDICQIQRVSGKKKIENAFSEALGMINLYSDFIKLLNNQYSLDLKLNDAERILKNGLKIKGIEVDITEAKGIFRQYVDKIINRLRVEYPIDTLDVCLTGGGAIVLGRLFNQKLPQSIVLENSLFANANIFKKVGENLWQK